MNQKIIRPVLRYPGSKFRKLNKITSILDIKKEDTFLDMFGGSGIIGVNIKHQIGCHVVINDYDKAFPITDGKALKNMLSFQGLGRNFTKDALKYFNGRVENGYWDKLKKYNEILKDCEIININWSSWLDFEKYNSTWKKENRKIYVDPPYHKIKGLYKSDFTDAQHKKLLAILTLWSFNGDKILVSYNNTPFIRELYKDWFIYEEEFQYQTGKIGNSNKKKKVKELFITNFEIKEKDETKSSKKDF